MQGDNYSRQNQNYGSYILAKLLAQTDIGKVQHERGMQKNAGIGDDDKKQPFFDWQLKK
jgi:hypothetical protein